MRRLFLVLVIALCAQCSPKPCSPRILTPGGGTAFVIAGDPARVGVNLSVCPDTELGADVVVLDPLGDELEATVEKNQYELFGELEGSVTAVFTPVRPGPHHVTMRVQPNLGIVQLDVDVADDRRNAQWSQVLLRSKYGGCTHIDVLPVSKEIVCLPPPSARIGNVVWKNDFFTLSRWVDTDAGLVREPDVELAQRAMSLLPAENDVYAVSSAAELTHVFVDGGTLQAQPTVAAPALSGDWIAWRTQDSAAILTGIGVPLGYTSEGLFSTLSTSQTIQRWFDFSQTTRPDFSTYSVVTRRPTTWDTAALLSKNNSLVKEDVVLGFSDAGEFTYAAFGDVVSATGEWITVDRNRDGGVLYLLHR